jgi:S1-C subfamily serine protease
MKSSRIITAIVFGLILNSPSSAQVPRPKHESRLRHLFGSHGDTDNLESRYKDLACALVVIQSGNHLGTGFYISSDGDVATASHVLGDRIFSVDGQQLRIDIPLSMEIVIRNSVEEFTIPSKASVESNADDWSADLALLKTGRRAPCWLKVGDDKLAKPGQHVVAMGFPGLAFGSLSLYTGIISARLKSDLIMGFTAQGQALRSTNEFLRVQMPISTGISGAPVIDDENQVIAVVTNAGAWSPGLEALTRLANTNQLGMPVPQPNTLNLPALVGQLAGLIHDYVSPGYGDAVPLSYLEKKAPQGTQTPSSTAH